MGIVYQKNKKTGITYVYKNEAYWDKEKQQSRAKRTLIGKLNTSTGEIVPTRSYRKDSILKKPGPVPITKIRRDFYGACYLLDQVGKITEVEADLKACFPDRYRMILSVAYYLILEENNSLSRFSRWQRLHAHPYGEDIPSQRGSELFQSISEEERMMFFKKQGRRRIEKEYWAFDITSISSYSETLSQVKKGRNKEYDRLPHINLALLFGEQSGLPFYYRKLPGNITDVKTVKQLMAEFNVMGYKKVSVLLDRGFYSRENINLLFKNHQKFIIGVKLNLNYVKEILEEERENLQLWSNLQPQFRVYGLCRTIQWDYEQERPNKGDVLRSKRRACLHLFHNLFEALSLYRSKDIVEKGFGNLKDRLNFGRMQVSSELSLNGKLFVEFVALIYLSYIKKKMQETGLFENWTLQGLLDELDTIERFDSPEHGHTIGEVTEKQKDIYAKLGVKSPSL